MSGFSAELIDYLEGRITFEEFDKRRDERRAKVKKQLRFLTIKKKPEEEEEEEEDTLSYLDDEDDEDYKVNEVEEKKLEVKEKVKKRKGERGRRKKKEENYDDYDEEGDPTVGDVFALEMKLNRENKKMMKERRHRSKLPRALRGLMGEANIRYARGEKEEAIMMCMEIIRQAPLAFEPFSTLAMIYEDDEDTEKALQFGLIAAHLNPSDSEEWIRLAEMSLQQDNIRQAILCYTKAIKYDPTNVRYLWERSNLHMRMGEQKQCMDGYRRILSLLPMEEGEHFMQLSKDMAKSYYESNDLGAALGIIEEALDRHPGLVSDDFVNMAAELNIAKHNYSKALQVLVQFAGIVLIRDESRMDVATTADKEKVPGQECKIKDVQVPDSIPVDLKAKLIVCLIYLHVSTPLEGLVTSLMEQSAEEIGDLYLDVAEAYLDQGEYVSALPLLSVLVVSEKYNLAVVWLRHAECLKALGDMEMAAESYTKVVQMAPLHLEARLSLATLQQQLGRPEHALKALESMYDSETLAQDSSASQKLMLMENVDLPHLWNIFNQLTITSQHQRHHRFCLRLLLKHPDSHALWVLCGHNAMVSGSFKHALGQYVQAFQTHPDNPLYSLCIGLTFFHMASQKYVAKRHALVLQGFSFLWRYLELRGNCQESMYNLGRAVHQLGLTHLAIHYYQTALALPVQNLEGIADDQVDLRREIAFNLSLIYQTSGNTEMARQLINTHCIV
ncbi:unnamed protein product, partial [Tetraodon nigroviridis]